MEFSGCAGARPVDNFGGYSGGETPLPIPNREVKPASADGTRRATSRESRTPPIIDVRSELEGRHVRPSLFKVPGCVGESSSRSSRASPLSAERNSPVRASSSSGRSARTARRASVRSSRSSAKPPSGWVAMLLDSMKARDLQRDPRILVHSIVTQPDGGFAEGEYKVRGSALEVTDPGLVERVAQAIDDDLPWHPEPGKFHLFRVDVEDVTFIRWEGENNQYMTRWPEGREQVRRGTSATSVGAPEPHSEFLD